MIKFAPRGYIYLGYKTPSAALHFITGVSSYYYRWFGLSFRNTFIGVMVRRPRNPDDAARVAAAVAKLCLKPTYSGIIED